MSDPLQLAAFRVKFPELSALDDPAINNALDDANLFVQDSDQWDPEDLAAARLFWAAHWLAVMQQQSAGVTDGLATGMTADLYVNSVSFGERRVSFGQRRNFLTTTGTNAGSGLALLPTTTYGQKYIILRDRNLIIPVLVV